MKEKEILIRHGKPNAYDLAEYGTEIHIIGRSKCSIYQQTSKDPEKPNWELIDTYPIAKS